MEELNEIELDPSNPLVQSFQRFQEVLRAQYEQCCGKRSEINNSTLKISAISS